MGEKLLLLNLINGDNKTGVSIFKLEEKLDSGVILCAQEIVIDHNINKEELTSKLNIIGINLLFERYFPVILFSFLIISLY